MDNNVKESVGGSSKNDRQKKALIFIVAALVIGVISGALLLLLGSFEGSQNKEDDTPSFNFYTPDYDLDVTKVREYMELDRLLYYRDGGVEVGICGNADEFGVFAVFFEKYFEAVIGGDTKSYSQMFTESYIEKNGVKDDFTPQMIYDIHVTRLRGVTEDETERIAFDVSYRIFRNDGTFRNDVGSDAARVLYFELAFEDGEYKIDRIAYYS